MFCFNFTMPWHDIHKTLSDFSLGFSSLVKIEILDAIAIPFFFSSALIIHSVFYCEHIAFLPWLCFCRLFHFDSSLADAFFISLFFSLSLSLLPIPFSSFSRFFFNKKFSFSSRLHSLSSYFHFHAEEKKRLRDGSEHQQKYLMAGWELNILFLFHLLST